MNSGLKIYWYPVILILNTFTALAQVKSTPTMNELKLKSKQELIQMAVAILKEKQPSLVIDSDDFESTTWGNSKEIVVKFRRYIRFIPLKKDSYNHYHITVNLVTKQILPFESGYSPNFYIPSEEDKKKLDFVQKKADLPKQSASDITISENEDNYWISITTETAISKFIINKKTGFKSGVMKGSYSLNQTKPVLESIYQREEKVKLHDEDEVSKITKNAIIQIAIEILKKRQPTLELNFDDFEITVLGDSKNTEVDFRRIVHYIPFGFNLEKRRISYDLTVNLNTNEISPFDDTFESEFYIETKKDKEALAFIKKNTGVFPASFENTVYEGEEDYFIDAQNMYSLSKSKLNKKTGVVEFILNAHMDPPTPVPNIIIDTNNLLEIIQ